MGFFLRTGYPLRLSSSKGSWNEDCRDNAGFCCCVYIYIASPSCSSGTPKSYFKDHRILYSAGTGYGNGNRCAGRGSQLNPMPINNARFVSFSEAKAGIKATIRDSKVDNIPPDGSQAWLVTIKAASYSSQAG